MAADIRFCSTADFLKSYMQTSSVNASELSYATVAVNLNSGLGAEHMLYLRGPRWCGSGGCTVLVLEETNAGCRLISKITVVKLPVRVLEAQKNGWRSIGVWVEGGGISPGYEAELGFNGRGYPPNPTVRPALRGKAGQAGVALITSASAFIALVD
jgi:hypothetical protein